MQDGTHYHLYLCHRSQESRANLLNQEHVVRETNTSYG
jgi:hypothetical protein